MSKPAATTAAGLMLTSLLLTSATAFAQAPAPSAPPASASASQAAPAASSSVAAAPVAGEKRSAKPAIRAAERCMRLPLSDVAFGKEASIAAARQKLEEYAAAEAKRRKWSPAPLIKSNEVVGNCDVYLDFGPLVGTEYRCLVTATYCQK